MNPTGTYVSTLNALSNVCILQFTHLSIQFIIWIAFVCILLCLILQLVVHSFVFHLCSCSKFPPSDNDTSCELCVRNNNHISLLMRQLRTSKSKQKRLYGWFACVLFECILSKKLPLLSFISCTLTWLFLIVLAFFVPSYFWTIWRDALRMYEHI